MMFRHDAESLKWDGVLDQARPRVHVLEGFRLPGAAWDQIMSGAQIVRADNPDGEHHGQLHLRYCDMAAERERYCPIRDLRIEADGALSFVLDSENYWRPAGFESPPRLTVRFFTVAWAVENGLPSADGMDPANPDHEGYLLAVWYLPDEPYLHWPPREGA